MAITAQQAVDRGFWMVKVPSMTLLVGPLLGFWAAAQLKLIPSVGPAAFRWFLPVFLFAFAGGWLAWSIQVPKWRLWAYERVDDIGELKRLAVAAQLLWPDGHFFERTEIASRQVRERLRALEAAKLG